jgi:hypothetical protein
MKLHEEFKEYSEMWDRLNEWVTTPPTSNNNQTTSPVASNVPDPIKKVLGKKRDAAGLTKHSKEFKKLLKHLNDLHTIDWDYEYNALGDYHFCISFTTDTDITYYLDVTTSVINSSNFGFKDQWDYVLQEMAPNNHIIGRGYIADYEALLDILLKNAIIKRKSACV